MWKNDVEIDFINKKRKIPFVLTDIENKLYGYSESITRKLLEEMKIQHEEELKNQSMDETEANEDESLDFP